MRPGRSIRPRRTAGCSPVPRPTPLCDRTRVVVREVQELAAARAGAPLLPRWRRLALEAGEALHDVAEEARLALLAVGDDVDTGLRLPADDIGHRLAHEPRVGVAAVGLRAVLGLQERDEDL